MKTPELPQPTVSPPADFPACVARARRSKGLTQSALAHAVSCKQSAISMLERGNLQAVSLEKQSAIAAYLEIEWLPETLSVAAKPAPAPKAYCPHFDCPANIPYQMGPRLIAMPRMEGTQAGRYCRYCGEICETHCPHCHAPYQYGAYCSHCGNAYIPVSSSEKSPSEWADWIVTQQKLLTLLP